MRIPENLGQISAFPFVRLVGWVVAPELKYRESGRHRCRVNPGSLTGGKSDQVFLDSLFLNRFSWLRYQNVRLKKLEGGPVQHILIGAQTRPLSARQFSPTSLMIGRISSGPFARLCGPIAVLFELRSKYAERGHPLTFRDEHFDTSTIKIG